jgi:hypothetical protein
LNSIGIKSKCLTLSSHPFGYEKQAIKVGLMGMMEAIESAEVIIIGHSSIHLLKSLSEQLKGKRVWVLHTGTPYRQNHEIMNEAFNPIVELTLTDSPEFMTLGAKNIHYIAGAIDTDEIQFSTHKNDELTFAHYPSNHVNKGTKEIKQMMMDYAIKFVCDEAVVPHKENLKRISECDVYIELFAPKQRDKVYGSFGVTAFEAAAMGKVVITNSLYDSVYEATYGPSELVIANTESDFKGCIHQLIQLQSLDDLKQRNRFWIEKTHSYSATGTYLNTLLEKR